MAEDQSYGDYLIKYAFVITPYASVTSLLYLWGYWSAFNINVFAFISLTDILKLALPPVIYLVMASVGAAVYFYFIISLQSRSDMKRQQPTIPLSPRATFIFNCVLGVVAIIIVIAVPEPLKFFLAGMTGAVLLARILENLEVSKRLIPNINLRLALALSITTPPLIAFGLGRLQANSVLKGINKARLVDAKLFREYGSDSFNKKLLLQGQDKLKLIGVAGDYVFFLSVDNSKVFIVKFADLHFIEFNN